MNAAILAKVCAILQSHEAFEDLVLHRQIYPVPTITWLPSGSELEVQVADGGAAAESMDGSVELINFQLEVGIMLRRPKGYGGKVIENLTSEAQSLFKYRDSVREALTRQLQPGGEDAPAFLGGLITRPLTYAGESKVLTDGKYPDLLVKIVRFTGGVNGNLLE